MGLSAIYKKIFRSRKSNKEDNSSSNPVSNTTSANSSQYTTPAPSRPSSVKSTHSGHYLTVNSTNSKYLSNPMRNSNVPEYVGGFTNPMGGKRYVRSLDCTNTGA
ncbi:hypothetical protein BDC45DRAFT_569994 [Circinella umbellata]|nr:hypothetical protein BDC45DRAFT_569994 [Circinella umbellata]